MTNQLKRDVLERDLNRLAMWLDEHDPGWRGPAAEACPVVLAGPADLVAHMALEYGRATARLVALLHGTAIPTSWRHDRSAPLTLTEAVDRVCELIPSNTLGAPPGYEPPPPMDPAAAARLVADIDAMTNHEETR